MYVVEDVEFSPDLYHKMSQKKNQIQAQKLILNIMNNEKSINESRKKLYENLKD